MGSWVRRPARLLSIGLLAASVPLAWAAPPAHALSIVPTFDSSITSNANAAQIEAAINLAIQPYAMFADPVTVNILYQGSSSGSYLGESASSIYTVTYSSYTGALAADAAAYNNTVEQTAVNNLGSGNTAADIAATSADLRALGGSAATFAGTVGSIDLSNNTVVGGGSYDGAIAINLSKPLQFSRNANGTISSGTYDAISVIQHETDEVLGIGGAGSALNTINQSGPQTYIGPLDLYRYSAAGTPSLATSGSAISYFSINGGVTNIVGFNQNSGGDYGDWSTPGYVQDGFTSPGQVANVTTTSPEGIALQAIGYDVPEPSSLTLFGLAAACLMGLRRSQRRRLAGV